MKQVNINAYQIGLVFKKGEYQYSINKGTYWLWNQQVYVYELTNQFIPPIELSILLADETLSSKLIVVDVHENEIALHFENDILKSVLTTGRYAFWKEIVSYNFIKIDISTPYIQENISRSLLSNRLLQNFVRSNTVESFEKGVLLVDGKFVQELEGGTYYWWKNSTSVIVGKIDMRQQQLEINGQEILTKDKAALRINAVVHYKISDIQMALLQNKDYEKQLYIMFQLFLREYIGSLHFDELLEKKESISNLVFEKANGESKRLGISIVSFGIRDIILPGDVKEIMYQVLVAEKKAQANIIMRREETASTRSLLNTAKLMEENTMLWKLKEMEYVEKIAEKISNISVNGNGDLIGQLKQIFVPQHS